MSKQIFSYVLGTGAVVIAARRALAVGHLVSQRDILIKIVVHYRFSFTARQQRHSG